MLRQVRRRRLAFGSSNPDQRQRILRAVRKGIDKPIEIYDLAKDPGESKNLAESRADLVTKAQSIFDEAHRPDSNWPLDRRAEKHIKLAKQAWKIKRERDKTKWIPENAIKIPTE